MAENTEKVKKENPQVGELNDPAKNKSNGKGSDKEIRIVFQEAGVEGLDIHSGFISEAYHSQLYWPTVEPLFSRLRRSMPEVVMVRQAFTSWARRVRLTVELPDEPTDDDKKYQEFVESVFEDVEGGQTKLLDTMVNHTPFMGWALWEAVPGRRNPEWKPPRRMAPNGKVSYPDDWRSEYDDDLIGFRRFGFRSHNSFKEWLEQPEINNVIGMRQMVEGQPDVDLLFKDCLHLTYGDPDNPEGLSPLEAVWRLERIRFGLEVIQGIGFEHAAGHLAVKKEQSGTLSKDAKAKIQAAARAVLTAKEGNYAYWPYGLDGQVMDIPFQAAGSLLDAIKHYSILSLSVFMMQWMALNTLTGTGSYAAMDDSSTMGVATFNAMLDGFAAQIDEQLGKRLWQWNQVAFPNVTKRPKIKITHIEKDVALAEMGAFAVQMSNIMPLAEEDFIAIRERSGFLPTTVPEEDEAKEKQTPFSEKDEDDSKDTEEDRGKDDSKDDSKDEDEKDEDRESKKADMHYGPGPHPSGTSQDVHAPHGSFREARAAESKRRATYNPKEKQPPLPTFKTNEEVWAAKDEIEAERAQLFKKDWERREEWVREQQEKAKGRLQRKYEGHLMWNHPISREEYIENVTGGGDYAVYVDMTWDSIKDSYAEDDIYTLVSNAYDFYDEETGIESAITDISAIDKETIKISGTFQSGSAYVGKFEMLFGSDGQVYNDYTELRYGAQGTGFGTRWMENVEAQLMRGGAESIELLANLDVGGYAWARMGYDFAPYEYRKEEFMNAYKYAWDEWYEEAAENVFKESGTEGFILPYMEPPEVEHAWELAAMEHPYAQYTDYEHRFGQALLLDTSWNAIKYLHPDDEGSQIGEIYYGFK
jgi:hypothetical protein